MKKIIFLIYFLVSSVLLMAQDSSVEETQNELLPAMNTIQRTALKPFESLQIIDTGDNNVWIYKNAKWHRVFSDEDILKAKKNRVELLTKSESWKEFDEISKPQTESSKESTANSVELVQNLLSSSNTNTLRYLVITPSEVTNGSIQIDIKNGEKLAFVKIHTDNAKGIEIMGFEHISKNHFNSLLIQPLKVENQTLSLSIVDKSLKSLINEVSSSKIKGILIGIQKAD